MKVENYEDMKIDISEAELDLICKAIIKEATSSSDLSLSNSLYEDLKKEKGNYVEALGQVMINDFLIKVIKEQLTKT